MAAGSLRWLLALQVILTLLLASQLSQAAPGDDCNCVVPMDCPEGVLMEKPRKCKLPTKPSGDGFTLTGSINLSTSQKTEDDKSKTDVRTSGSVSADVTVSTKRKITKFGVCCPKSKEDKPKPFELPLSRDEPRHRTPANLISGGVNGELELIKRSNMPEGAKVFFSRLALDEGDNIARFTIKVPRRRKRLFSTVFTGSNFRLPQPPRRRVRPGVSSHPTRQPASSTLPHASANTIRFLVSAGVVVRPETALSKPTKLTGAFNRNFRSLPESQWKGIEALQILQQGGLKKADPPAHVRRKRSADPGPYPQVQSSTVPTRRCLQRGPSRCLQNARTVCVRKVLAVCLEWNTGRCLRKQKAPCIRWSTPTVDPSRFVIRCRRRSPRRCVRRAASKCVKWLLSRCIKSEPGRCLQYRRGTCLDSIHPLPTYEPPGPTDPKPTEEPEPEPTTPTPTDPDDNTVPNCRPEPYISCRGNSRFRTINGACNNLNRPRWGRRLTGLRRLFDNTFEDGIFAPRQTSVRGGDLPSARDVSLTVFQSDGFEERKFTMSLVTFGQFMDHDLSISPIFQTQQPNGSLSAIECCGPKGSSVLPVDQRHPQCLPIPVGAHDSFFKQFNVRCLNFVRSLPAPDYQCRPRPATQINEITSWIDLSQVYGSSHHKSDELREYRHGFMKVSSGDLLPHEIPVKGCNKDLCFKAGDERANENIILALFHTIFVREHNRIARELAKHHSGAADGFLYEEARRINIAEWQHIAYNEWLPALVGHDFARQVGLSGHPGRHTYTPFLNPSISTEFSSAGFRLHSMVQGIIELVNEIGNAERNLQLDDTFFEPTELKMDKTFNEIARGIVRTPPQRFDGAFTMALRGNLFRVGQFGLDLPALNIQRGRDHGIPTYVTVASRCNGLYLDSFDSLRQLISPSDVKALQGVYKDYRDVDLFAGLNLETRVPGALLGPTSICLIADQFLRARYGDRFFYDQAGQKGSFTEYQLKEIKKASWARILCDNVGRDFDSVQPLAFLQPTADDGANPYANCLDEGMIPKVNLTLF